MVNMISTEICFTRLSEAELSLLVKIRNENRSYLHCDREFTLMECTDWFRREAPDFLCVWEDETFVGYVRLNSDTSESLEIRVRLDLERRFQGQGLGYPIYLKLFKFLESDQEAKVFTLETLSHNHRALNLYKKLGFHEIRRISTWGKRDGDIFMARKPLEPDL
jgi:RimJ/RimL family protein N-acetyltransferase